MQHTLATKYKVIGTNQMIEAEHLIQRTLGMPHPDPHYKQVQTYPR